MPLHIHGISLVFFGKYQNWTESIETEFSRYQFWKKSIGTYFSRNRIFMRTEVPNAQSEIGGLHYINNT